MISNKALKNLYEKFLEEATSLKKISPSAKKPVPALNTFIDHTLLKPEATLDQIKTLCAEAAEHEFATVCVQPLYIVDCVRFLKKSKVKPITVIGFPLGANTIETKIFEAKNAIANGAKEIDMVWNISALKSGKWDYVYDEICALVEACGKIPVKVIIETALLTHEEKVFACACLQKAGADFIKTSTGFSSSGAVLEDILLFKTLLKNSVKIKASGGIKTTKQAQDFIAAGADRLGTSSGVEIMKNISSQKDY